MNHAHAVAFYRYWVEAAADTYAVAVTFSVSEHSDEHLQTPQAIEDELRDAYVRLETKRSQLWTPGALDSFRRDRYELDARCVHRLVRIKWALATRWEASGQFDGLSRSGTSV